MATGPFEILARDGSARSGVIRTAHGAVETPAFVPLASSATVKTLTSAEVAELGYELVLGNTYHLFIQPGAERIEALGGLHEFMGWSGPIITDSGGFQVFSLGTSGSVADEVKRSGDRRLDRGQVLAVEEEGVRFRSYLDGDDRFMGPETSMEVQARLGTDIALAFDECTPFHSTRDYIARSTERTHRWLDRCIGWRQANAPEGQLFYGIVQGGTEEDLRVESAERVAAAAVDGIAIGGSLGKDKEQMLTVVGWALAALPEALPRHLLGIGDPDDILVAVEHGVDTFDCATPTRLARHGTALIGDPDARFRLDLARSAHADSREPIERGCACPTCAAGHTRAYLHYLVRAREPTAAHLLTLHNLAYMARLMEGLRAAITAGALAAYADGVRAGRLFEL